MIEHIAGQTFHARLGGLSNAFRYGVDYVLTDLNEPSPSALFSRNRFNLWSLYDRDHGGARGAGIGRAWFEDVLRAQGMDLADTQLVLLAQPRFLGMRFNPVSFWVALRDDRPCAFVAEVNNTFGHRHCYFCAHPDFRPIGPADALTATKLMHVSPFQTVAGGYRFRLGWQAERITIHILYTHGKEGVMATLGGQRRPMTTAGLSRAALRRPFGGARVWALIHWQALKLWRKRAPFLKKQPAPDRLLSVGGEAKEPHP